MGDEQDQKAKNYFKGLMQKAQGAINLVIGNPEVYSMEDAGGDLEFDPAFMMKINVTFDKDFLPKEKVVKLNARGNRFFNDLKRNIREINGVFIVYPNQYEVQFDVRRNEWEKRLIDELNSGYHLALKKIYFISEEDVCTKYQKNGITAVKNPYNIKPGELLIIAGGFANFDTQGEKIAEVKADLVTTTAGKGGKPVMLKKSYQVDYFKKHSDQAGAYFYVGGEWYHNLFIPELYHPENPRFFFFRLSEDCKSLKFFSDLKKRGIDILSDTTTIPGPDRETILYTINPEYFQETGINDFKLSIITYIPKIEEEEEERAGQDIEAEDAAEIAPEIAEPPSYKEENLPYLENEMILLPLPKNDDIASYIMSIGGEKKNVKFYSSSVDGEVSILSPESGEKIYKRGIYETVDYTAKLDSIHYSISNSFLARVDDKELKIYFGWSLQSNVVERTYLEADFYIFGREPLDNLDRVLGDDLPGQLARLNQKDDDFWRIGASRDHAVLVKEDDGDSIYNISLSYPIYLVAARDLEKPVIPTLRVEPVPGGEKEKKLAHFLADIRKEMSEHRAVSDIPQKLAGFAQSAALKNNDLVIIGSRVFKYIVPLVTESPLSARVQKSILRKINVNRSIIRR